MSTRRDGSPVTLLELERAMADLTKRINHAFRKHGRGKFRNALESLGALQLEFDEYKKEVQDCDLTRQRDELLDVATVCIVSAASINL